ncbi:MAG: prepilin-type N-terminal cleavage/methylation domain-containing protein [Paenibacillaceae bacterium]|nr:prepilin-type N-terminal cleavage/methylation domain-containing protein [Paenibacillaceae bacterium]
MLELMKKRKSVLGNENGLTLVELLAVIVILAIISAIAIPSIGGIINGTKKNAHQANAIMIIDAARYKAINDEQSSATSYDLDTLFKGGYLNAIPQDPANKNKTYDLSSKVYVDAKDGVLSYRIELIKLNEGDYYANTTTESSLKDGTAVLLDGAKAAAE